MKLIPVLILIVALSSCIKNNPNPSWIEIGAWQLEANPSAQYPLGELTHNFTDAWVYVNDELIGVFELPVKLPILKSGEVNIKLFPAVKVNGISSTKKIYPFVDRYEATVQLKQDEVTQISPVTTYFDITQAWIEDFEDAAIKLENDPNTSSAKINTENDPAILKWGNFYGRVNLTSTDSMWVGYSTDMVLPKGKEVFLEIDYYNTNACTTGLLAISLAGVKANPNIQLNPQNPNAVRWKKMYIDLKELVSNSYDAAYFKQSFQAILDHGDSEGFVVLDNIKVVHF